MPFYRIIYQFFKVLRASIFICFLVPLLVTCDEDVSPATCKDGILNNNETGIDCGGDCAPCPSCDDGIQNQNETGVDCGGVCSGCENCNDGIQNQNETGIDCGGDCVPCGTCDDGIQNQGEEGIDCGGFCTPCGSCSDGIQNQNEAGVDCGGPCQLCNPPRIISTTDISPRITQIKRVREVIKNDLGEYAYIGNRVSESNFPGSIIVKSNSTGEIIFEKEYGIDSFFFAYALTETSDGGFIGTGREEFGDQFVIKVDDRGNSEFVEYCDYGTGYDILQLKDGNFILIGEGRSYGLITYINSRGEIVWSNEVRTSSLTYSPYDLIQGSDGNLILAGISSNSSGDLWVMKFDISGRIIWEEIVGGGSGVETTPRIIETIDGFAVVVESYSKDRLITQNNGSSDVWFVKLDKHGKYDWSRNFGGSEYDRVSGITQTSDGGYLISAYTGSPGPDGIALDEPAAWLFKINSQGTMVWELRIANDTQDFGLAAFENASGTISFVGKSRENDLARDAIWVVELSF